MTNYLEHHGILGMKWGVRRYQYKDGTLTPAGRRRYRDEKTIVSGDRYEITTRQKELTEEDLRILVSQIDMTRRLDEIANGGNGNQNSNQNQSNSSNQSRSRRQERRDERHWRAERRDRKAEQRRKDRREDAKAKVDIQKGRDQTKTMLDRFGNLLSVTSTAAGLYYGWKKYEREASEGRDNAAKRAAEAARNASRDAADRASDAARTAKAYRDGTKYTREYQSYYQNNYGTNYGRTVRNAEYTVRNYDDGWPRRNQKLLR